MQKRYPPAFYAIPVKSTEESLYFNNTNPIEVANYLKGLTYPTDKPNVIACAQKNKAPDAVLQLIKEFSDKKYDNPIILSKEVTNLNYYRNIILRRMQAIKQ